MKTQLTVVKHDFIGALSRISRFWGFPKGMGAIFAVLYLSPAPLSLDELVRQTRLTKGAISTQVRTLARMGLVHRSTQLGDRKDYYQAESDFYKSIRSILRERQNREFERDLIAVRSALALLQSGSVAGDAAELHFVYERVRALQEFFDAIDKLTNAVIKLDRLGIANVNKILGVLK